MISHNTIKLISSALKPFANSGVIPEPEFKEVLTSLRKSGQQSNVPEVTPSTTPKLITRSEAAAMLSVGPRTIDRLCDAGKLDKHYLADGQMITDPRGYKRSVGSVVRIAYDSVVRFINRTD